MRENISGVVSLTAMIVVIEANIMLLTKMASWAKYSAKRSAELLYL